MSRPSVVSLFTGAGGLDHGFEAAGFETRACVEMDTDCCETLRANTDWAVIEGDIHKVSSKGLLDVAGLKKGSVDLVLGGPPCQPFSKAGYWVNGNAKRMEDPRAKTLEAYMRVVEDLQPQAFVLENVHGINYSGKEEGFTFLEKATKRINERTGSKYSINWKVLNAADHGVPQMRKRFFLVAEREGRSFSFPEVRNFDDDGNRQMRLDGECEDRITAWDAIGHLADVDTGEDLRVKGAWGDLLPSIPEGENYLWHTDRKGGLPLFGWRTRYWSFLLKLAKSRPAWTIQAQPGPAIGPFHWTSRMLSWKELAAIQTFPKDVEFHGGRQSVQRQIGNAVPSLLGEVVAREILRQLFDAKVSEGCSLKIERRRPIPSPEEVAPVPDKYLHLVGEHPDHPGTGKGPIAFSHLV